MSHTPPPEHRLLENEHTVTIRKDKLSSILELTGEDQLPTSAKALEALVQLKIEKERVNFETLRNSNLKLALEFLNCSLKAQVPPHLIPSMFPSTYETIPIKKISSQEPLVVANMTFPKKARSNSPSQNPKRRSKAEAPSDCGALKLRTDKAAADSAVDKTCSPVTSITMETPVDINATEKPEQKVKKREAELKVRQWQKSPQRKGSCSVEKPLRSPFSKRKGLTKPLLSLPSLDTPKQPPTRVCSTESISSTLTAKDGTSAAEMTYYKPENFSARPFDNPVSVPSHLLNQAHSYPPNFLPTYSIKYSDPMAPNLPLFYGSNSPNVHVPPPPDMMYRKFVTMPPHYPYPYPIPQVMKPAKSQPSSLELRQVSVHSTSTTTNPTG